MPDVRAATMNAAPLLRSDVPLAAETTFGIGGSARLFAAPRSREELVDAVSWAREQALPVHLLGHGSNVLVGDRGFDGLVVGTAGVDHFALPEGGRLYAEAGADLGRLIESTVAHGLSGLEHFAGIPSSLGGGLWQNLHFLTPERDRLVYLGDLVEEATVLEGGDLHTVHRDWFGFGYDRSVLRSGDAIVVDATLRLTPTEPAVLRARVEANLAWRRTRHPVRAETRSAGCVFRNPPGGSAARAIDAAGLKGTRVGGAVVSRRHANFVLNTGGATAAHVLELVALVAERVERRFGLRLEPEIDFVGCALPVAA